MNLLSSRFYCSSGPQSENERKQQYKYLDLARGQKKMQNMKVTVIAVVVIAFGTVPKELERKLGEMETRDENENIQIAALLRSDMIEVLET